MFDFVQLPDFVFQEILFLLPRFERNVLILLNRKIFYTFISSIYARCIILNPDDCKINFKVYGKYIKNLTVHSIGYKHESYEELFNRVQEHLNPNCSLSINFYSSFKVDHIDVFNKFKVDRFSFHLAGEYRNNYDFEDFFNKLNTINPSKISINLNGIIVSQNFLEFLLSHKEDFEMFSSRLTKFKLDCYINQIADDFISHFNILTYLSIENVPENSNIISLLEKYHPNLELLYIKCLKSTKSPVICEINGKNYPKLRNLFIGLHANINFINSFRKLKLIELTKSSFIPSQVEINLPESKNFKALSLHGFSNEEDIWHIIKLSKGVKINHYRFSFLNLTFLNVSVRTLLKDLLISFLKPPKLKMLVLSWSDNPSGLTKWFKTNPQKLNLPLQYIHIFCAESCNFLIDYLVASSPHLIEISGNSWLKEYCEKINAPFKDCDLSVYPYEFEKYK